MKLYSVLFLSESLFAEAAPAIPSYEGTFFKMVLSLVGLLALVLITIWLLKKMSHGRFGSFGAQKSIQILEKKSLSPKTLLYIVEIDGKKVLLAESQLEVRAILPLHPDQEDFS